MTIDAEDERFGVQDVRHYYSPSKPVFKRKSQGEWKHDEDAEIVPWWVMPMVIVAILVLAVLVVNANHLLALFI